MVSTPFKSNTRPTAFKMSFYVSQTNTITFTEKQSTEFAVAHIVKTITSKEVEPGNLYYIVSPLVFKRRDDREIFMMRLFLADWKGWEVAILREDTEGLELEIHVSLSTNSQYSAIQKLCELLKDQGVIERCFISNASEEYIQECDEFVQAVDYCEANGKDWEIGLKSDYPEHFPEALDEDPVDPMAMD